MKKKFKNVVGGDYPPDMGIMNWSHLNSPWTGNLEIAEEHKFKKFWFGSAGEDVYFKYLYTQPKTHHFVRLKPRTTNLHPDNVISYQSYEDDKIPDPVVNYLPDEPPQEKHPTEVDGGKRIRKRKTNKRKTNKRKTFKKK